MRRVLIDEMIEIKRCKKFVMIDAYVALFVVLLGGIAAMFGLWWFSYIAAILAVGCFFEMLMNYNELIAIRWNK